MLFSWQFTIYQCIQNTSLSSSGAKDLFDSFQYRQVLYPHVAALCSPKMAGKDVFGEFFGSLADFYKFVGVNLFSEQMLEKRLKYLDLNFEKEL